MIKINTETSCSFMHSSSFLKPDAYINHNATQRQFIRHASSSGATRGFILPFHMCRGTPQDQQTHFN